MDAAVFADGSRKKQTMRTERPKRTRRIVIRTEKMKGVVASSPEAGVARLRCFPAICKERRKAVEENREEEHGGQVAVRSRARFLYSLGEQCISAEKTLQK